MNGRIHKLPNLLIQGVLLLASLGPLPLQAEIITDIEELTKPKDKKKEEAKPKTETPALPKATPLEIPPPAPPAPPMPNSVQIPGPKKSGKGQSVEQRRNAPIHLQSEGTATYSRDLSVVHLQQNVLITQDDIRLESNEAKVNLMEGKSVSNGVKSAELNGKVAMSRKSKDPTERMDARSDKAVFDNNQQIVTLEGNARLWRDGSLIKGDKITYEIATGMIKVDRAQGVVQPDKVKADKGNP